jgi:integrase
MNFRLARYFWEPRSMRTKLTTAAIEQAMPKGRTAIEMADSAVVGLRLVIQPSGHKSWAVRFRFEGQNRKLTIGPWPRIGLSLARELAAKALRKVVEGEDPTETKKEARREAIASVDTADLVETVFDQYRTRHLATLRRSTRKEVERLFAKRILPAWGKRRMGEITKRDVLAALDDMVASGAPISANRMLAALTAFFNWSISRDILALSPCNGVKKPTPQRPRERVLTDDELRWLWRSCDTIGWPFGPMTRLLILTGGRREEVRGLRERELRANDRLWTLPGERAKNGVQHDIHLTDAAVSALESVPRVPNEAGYVFSTNGRTAASGFSRAKDRLGSEMLRLARTEDDKAEIAPWVLHDLRRTMASGMARIGVRLEVIEKCLNHVSGSFGGIVGVYQRHTFADEKKAAFDSWARHVEGIVSRNPGNVVPMLSRQKRFVG